jgi:Concanavalin A-like lectin/glucanases superfamily
VVDSDPWPSLAHRYSFNQTAGSGDGTPIPDSVGGATFNGTFHGTGTFTGSQLVMPVNNPQPGGGTPNPAGGWVSFPSGQGIVNTLTNGTFECWVVWRGGNVWQEIFDFGAGQNPGFSQGGGNYVMFSPQRGDSQLLGFESFGIPGGGWYSSSSVLPIGTLCQVVCTHDQERQLDKIYINGQLQAYRSGASWLFSALSDTDNWLSRDQWGDWMFNGAYNDFRIWNGALTAGQVASLYAAGPNVVVGPQLNITPTTGGQLNVTWPANATSFILQSTTNLTSGAWSMVSGTPTVVNGLNTLTIGSSQARVFYRLKQ